MTTPASTTRLVPSPPMTTSPEHTVELGDLPFDAGGYLLVDRALRQLAPASCLQVRGADPDLALHLRVWARRQGHQVFGTRVEPNGRRDGRWDRAIRAGSTRAPAERAEPSWGFAARGSLVEGGGPELASADLDTKPAVWSDLAPRLYAQAAAAQWDPATAVRWGEPFELDPDIEDAVVQVMTYLVENEQAALAVPARFLWRIHPHYREVLQFLAVQLADEARHVEVFTRRAVLRRDEPGRSGAGGRASLQTLVEQPDFSVASFLLSVLGEGTFLHLLSFLVEHAPDPVTADVCRLALQDEARHVAFGMAHLDEQLRAEPALRIRLSAAVERRHDALATTAGLNDAVFDALTVLASGSWAPEAIAAGYGRVQTLQADMDTGRQRRLARLGFSSAEAAALSQLHTRNFM